MRRFIFLSLFLPSILNAIEFGGPIEELKPRTDLFLEIGAGYFGDAAHRGDFPDNSEIHYGGLLPRFAFGGGSSWANGVGWEVAYAVRAPLDVALSVQGRPAARGTFLSHEIYLGPSYLLTAEESHQIGFAFYPGGMLISPPELPHFRAMVGFLDAAFFGALALSQSLCLRATLGARLYRGLAGSAVGENPPSGSSGPQISVDAQGAALFFRLDLRWIGFSEF